MDVTCDSSGNQARTLAASLKQQMVRRQDLLIHCGLVLSITAIALLTRLPIVRGGLYSAAPSRDFGVVKAGEQLRATFVVTNLHPWPLTVVGVLGDCGCTNVFPMGRKTPFTLRPLESVPLKVTVDTSGKIGKKERIITVATSDFRSKNITDNHLTLRAVLE